MGSSLRRPLAGALAIALAAAVWPLVTAAPAAAIAHPAYEGASPVRQVDLDVVDDSGVGKPLAGLPDGSLLIEEPGRWARYDPDTGHRLAVADVPYAGTEVAVTDDGTQAYAVHTVGADSWIARYDLVTLHEQARTATPGWCPYPELALAGGRVWVACGRSIGLQSIDRGLVGPWVPVPLGTLGIVDHTDLAGVADDAPVLFLTGGAPPGSHLVRATLAGAVATVDVAVEAPVYDVVPSPDGTMLWSGPGLWDASTLEPLVAQAHSHVPVWLPDGRHLFGTIRSSGSSEALVRFSAADFAPTSGAALDPGDPYTDVQGDLAVSADGTEGYASSGTHLVVVRFGPEPAHLALDAPGSAGAGVLSGHLRLPDGTPVASQPIVVERVTLTGALPVGVGVAAADGAFRVADPLGVDPAVTYRARWLGDGQHPLGAIALRLTDHPTAAVAAALPVDREVTIPRMYPAEVVVDEAHGRVLALGDVTPPDSGDDLHLDAHIEIVSLLGGWVGTLPLASEPSEVELTPDGTHLLIPLPKLGRVEVLDAATLGRVGSIPTAPLLAEPTSLAVVGGDLWVNDRGDDPTLVAPLSAPTASDRPSLEGEVSPTYPLADRARPGTFLAGSSGYLSRWDVTQHPPQRVAVGALDVRPNQQSLVVPAVEGPLYQVWSDGIRELDRDTFATVGERTDAQRPVRSPEDGLRTSVAAGPGVGEVLAAVATSDGPFALDSEVVAWARTGQPTRRYDLHGASPEQLAVGAGGAVAAVVVHRGDHRGAYVPQDTSIVLLHDPFGAGALFGSLGDLFADLVTDVLGIVIPAQDLSWLADLVSSGDASVGQVTAWLTALGDGTRGAVARAYAAAVGRWPSHAELVAGEQQLLAGGTVATLVEGLAGSSAFRARFAGSTDAAFVDGLFRQVLGRAPGATERSGFLQALRAGVPRARAVAVVAASPELRRALAPLLEVELAYQGLLGRSASLAETWAWILDPTPVVDRFAALLGTPAYAQRVRSAA